FQASTESSSGTSGQVLSVPGYPPFELGKSRFDQSVFSGRLRQLLQRDRSQDLASKRFCAQSSCWRPSKPVAVPPGTTTRDLWEAQKVKDAILHPDTGKKIYRPFRMSGFVPYGTPIVVGLLLPHSRLWHTVFWQWLNQSHNAGTTASTLNVLLMRNSELSEGIEVFDENRQVVGTSKVAAKRIAPKDLEPELQATVAAGCKELYYNKGL
uniref:SET domain-containing protein n=1 Tax=Macrostomum lignano TaxID=282301 RepID=A0A1I8HZJ3_9PLAT